MTSPEQASEPRLFVFAGGGTGGHLAPGIAVAAELRRREPDCRIRFVGSGRPIEQRMLGPTGYELTAHDAPPLAQIKRRPLHFLSAHWRAIRDARRDFQADRPTAVIGLGGFASVPIVLAAQREDIPVVLLEQNVIPGRANWWLARRHPICVTFDETCEHLPRKATCHVTGNPLREEIVALHTSGSPLSSDERGRPTLLILGGSHGSRQINESALNAVRNLREQLATWHIIHQTGPDGSEAARLAYSECNLSATVETFFDNLPQLYAQTTIAISRAGATTLTELATAGIPSILIPYPLAAADHQTRNAECFAAAGAAILIDNPTRTSEPLSLTGALEELVTASGHLSEMSAAAETLARPEATQAVVDLLLASTR
jgi:UDP-N-acetylglucosamine--N-acetylmuramyl-(pentapeptide) pyrophosphoryl-undecaprenol N-acetylglucosamine transferase